MKSKQKHNDETTELGADFMRELVQCQMAYDRADTATRELDKILAQLNQLREFLKRGI